MADSFNTGVANPIQSTQNGTDHIQHVQPVFDETTPTAVDAANPLPVYSPKIVTGLGAALDAARLRPFELSVGGAGAVFDAIADYSSGAQMQLKPQTAHHLLVSELVVTIAVNAGFDAAKGVYGGRTNLATGIDVELRDLADEDSVTHSLLGLSITETRHWMGYASSVDFLSPVTASILRMTIPLAPAGTFLDIHRAGASTGEYLAVNLEDDFSSVGQMHRFVARGFELTDADYAQQVVGL